MVGGMALGSNSLIRTNNYFICTITKNSYFYWVVRGYFDILTVLTHWFENLLQTMIQMLHSACVAVCLWLWPPPPSPGGGGGVLPMFISVGMLGSLDPFLMLASIFWSPSRYIAPLLLWELYSSTPVFKKLFNNFYPRAEHRYQHLRLVPPPGGGGGWPMRSQRFTSI